MQRSTPGRGKSRKSITELDGFLKVKDPPSAADPDAHTKGKHRVFPDLGLEGWFKMTPRADPKSKVNHDLEFILWDPKKNTNVPFKNTDSLGRPREGQEVWNLKSRVAWDRFWNTYCQNAIFNQMRDTEAAAEAPEATPAPP